MKNSLSLAVISRVFANLCAIATAFISIRLYNLYVSKEIYGTILVGLQIIGYLPLMSGGFRMVLNQKMLGDKDQDAINATARFGQVLQTYFLVFVLLAGMGGMAIYGQLPGARAQGLPLMLFVSVGAAAAFTFQAGSQLAVLVAFGEQVRSSFLQSLWGILGLVVLWISFALGWGVWAFPASSGIAALLIILFSRIVLHQTGNDLPILLWHREKDFLERLKKVWRPAFDCLSNQVATVLAFSLDIIFVGILVGPGQATVYGIVLRVMGMSRQVLTSLSEAAWPRLTQELDGQRKAQMMKRVDRLNAWIVGCWFGAMAATIHAFLGWLVKADWLAEPLLIELMIARHFIISLASPHAYGLMSLGRFKDLSRLAQQEVVVGIVLGITLTYLAGMYGTAVAYLLASCSVTAWQLTREYFRNAGETHWFTEWIAVWSRAFLAAAISLAIAMAVWWLEKRCFAAPGWTAVLAGGLGFGVPIGVIMSWWKLSGRIP